MALTNPPNPQRHTTRQSSESDLWLAFFVLLAAISLTFIFLWAASQIANIETFKNLPCWLRSGYAKVFATLPWAERCQPWVARDELVEIRANKLTLAPVICLPILSWGHEHKEDVRVAFAAHAARSRKTPWRKSILIASASGAMFLTTGPLIARVTILTAASPAVPRQR